MSTRQIIKVNLCKHRVKKKSGKTYLYWCLRWSGSDGRPRGESIGRRDGPKKLSRRQAQLKRARKEYELSQHPGRRDVVSSHGLGTFLNDYINSRTSELAQGTLELHKLTARYLIAYFGNDRRICQITRANARAFKTALANGKLVTVSKRGKTPKRATVERSIREARTMFHQALQDELILSNPFNKLSKTVRIKKDWHYVDTAELFRLLGACPNDSWRMLLALCRLAGLRQGEALSLTWRDFDWEKNCLLVWGQKTKRYRGIPIAPELLPLLRNSFESAKEGESLVVPNINQSNLWRDFQVICRRAEVKTYQRWCQTLRKNREQDWNEKFPGHVVAEWMGHSESVAKTHYLRVTDRNIEAATTMPIDAEFTQLYAQLDQNKSVDKKGENHIVLKQKKI